MSKERKSLTVLVVEDNEFFREITRSLLKGHNVVFAHNGVEAIYKYQQQEPHIVFLDIELPDINGFDVLNRILKLNPNAKIVMLSGNNDKESVRNSIKLGAQGYIAKPVSKDKIDMYIQRLNTKTGT